jgi:hypothetical protein
MFSRLASVLDRNMYVPSHPWSKADDSLLLCQVCVFLEFLGDERFRLVYNLFSKITLMTVDVADGVLTFLEGLKNKYLEKWIFGRHYGRKICSVRTLEAECRLRQIVNLHASAI